MTLLGFAESKADPSIRTAGTQACQGPVRQSV